MNLENLLRIKHVRGIEVITSLSQFCVQRKDLMPGSSLEASGVIPRIAHVPIEAGQ